MEESLNHLKEVYVKHGLQAACQLVKANINELLGVGITEKDLDNIHKDIAMEFAMAQGIPTGGGQLETVPVDMPPILPDINVSAADLAQFGDINEIEMPRPNPAKYGYIEGDGPLDMDSQEESTLAEVIQASGEDHITDDPNIIIDTQTQIMNSITQQQDSPTKKLKTTHPGPEKPKNPQPKITTSMLDRGIRMATEVMGGRRLSQPQAPRQPSTPSTGEVINMFVELKNSIKDTQSTVGTALSHLLTALAGFKGSVASLENKVAELAAKNDMLVKDNQQLKAAVGSLSERVNKMTTVLQSQSVRPAVPAAAATAPHRGSVLKMPPGLIAPAAAAPIVKPPPPAVKSTVAPELLSTTKELEKFVGVNQPTMEPQTPSTSTAAPTENLIKRPPPPAPALSSQHKDMDKKFKEACTYFQYQLGLTGKRSMATIGQARFELHLLERFCEGYDCVSAHLRMVQIGIDRGKFEVYKNALVKMHERFLSLG